MARKIKKKKPVKMQRVRLRGWMREQPDFQQGYEGWSVRAHKDKHHTIPVTIIQGHGT